MWHTGTSIALLPFAVLLFHSSARFLDAPEPRRLGPIVLLGMGGIYVEIFDSASIRVWPIDRKDVMEMIEELAAAPILKGARGAEACDLGALADIVLRVGTLIAEHQQVQEVDLNPVRVYPGGALALDARVILGR